MKIPIPGTSYVGLSNAILLAQNNEVVALDIIPEKVALLDQKKPPIVDKEIEDFLANKPLNFQATLDKADAYMGANAIRSICKPAAVVYDFKFILPPEVSDLRI